jgi:hypothetical protein
VEKPPKVSVNTENLLEQFHAGFNTYGEIWQEVLTGDIHKKLIEIKGMKMREFNFPTDLWARVLFDTAVAYGHCSVDTDQMMESLIPLYFGRTLSFVKRTEKMSIKQAEEAIEEDCMTFETTKPYLLKRWQERGR